MEVLPDGADPMDIRYNVINWVNRSTRGWSTGASVIDPRTGEIIKATVTLGSLRGSAGAHPATCRARGRAHAGTGTQLLRQPAGMDFGDGLSASVRKAARGWHDRFVERLSGAHRRVDKVTIDYGYHEFANGANENAALTRIINDAWAKDLRFMTNQDLGVHPKVDQSSKG